MAKSNSKAGNGTRIVIPPGPPPAGEPEGEPTEPGALDYDGDDNAGRLETWGPMDNEGLNLFRETGDAAALSDASFADWAWQVYRLRTPDEVSRDRKGSRREWMMRLDGPLELTEIRRQCGGGAFEIWGYYAKRLRCRLRQDIGGPRRTFDRPEAAPVAAPSAVSVSRDDSMLVRALEQQGRTLDAIVRRLESPPQPAAPAMSVAEVFAIADRLNQREAPSPSGDVLKELVSAFRLGMEVKQDAGGSAAKTTAEILLEKLAPVAEKIAMAVVSGPRRPPGPPRRAAPPPSGSSAEVVDPPGADAAPPAAPEPDPGAHRWPAVVEALANAVARGDDPGVFVDTLELLLPPQELGMLRLAPAETLVAQLRESAGGQYPVLNTEQAAAFVQAALAELNRSDGPPD